MPIKVVLVLDNGPAHPAGLYSDEECGINCFTLHYISLASHKRWTKRVIDCLKRRYTRKLFSKILNKMELENKGLNVLKTINIKDIIYMVVKFFEDIPSSQL